MRYDFFPLRSHSYARSRLGFLMYFRVARQESTKETSGGFAPQPRESASDISPRPEAKMWFIGGVSASYPDIFPRLRGGFEASQKPRREIQRFSSYYSA